jgi:PTH1 family peptidyl-tRNA hydrolase
VIKLIVGLGNPGPDYKETRHNIGQMTLDHFSRKNPLNWKGKFKGEYAQLDMYGRTLYFLKPMTYMNLSGESVIALKTFFKIEINQILVIHDELDIPFGQLIFKRGGGLAGHNGLKSMAEHLGSNEFLRMRMGISRPNFGQDVSSWVLSRFSGEEKPHLNDYMDKAVEALHCSLKEGFDKASTTFGRKKLINI